MLLTIREIEAFHRCVVQRNAKTDYQITGDSITLTAAVELACIQYWLRHSGLRPTLSTNSKKRYAWELLEQSGWPATKSALQLTNGGTLIRTFSSRPTDTEWRSFFYLIRDRLKAGGFTPDSARAVAGAFGEMANNVWDHSMSDHPALLACHLKRGRALFCIADVGVGVLESLRQNPQFASLKTSTAALGSALKDGVSRFGTQGRGYGFSDLVRGVANQWGIARLRTGEGKLVLDHTSENRTRHSSYAPFLPGLQIAFTCGTNPPDKPVQI